MMRSMYSAVSGLKTHQTKMDVIGNNIANVNTVAFKSSSVVFQDVLYQMTSNASGANAATGTGGVNAKQIGLGVTTGATNLSITTSGAAETTGRAFDIRLSDQSTTNFFVVNNGSENLFTRAGSFYVDGAGNLCMTSTGYTVMGWQVDPTTGNIKKDTVSALRVMQTSNLTSAPEATTQANVSGIIDKNDKDVLSDNGLVKTLTFFDNLGYSYTARFAMKSTGTDGKYTVELEKILIPVANPDTIEDLVSLSLLIRDPKQKDNLVALNVINDNNASEALELRGKRYLEKAAMITASVDVPLKQISRYDLNIASGIIHTAKEHGVTDVIIGLHRKVNIVDSFFGMLAENLLKGLHREVMIAKFLMPINTIRRINIAVPPKAEYEAGFQKWVEHFCRMGSTLGCRVHFFANEETTTLLQILVKKRFSSTMTDFSRLDDWGDLLLLTGQVNYDHLLVIISARRGSISYDPAFERLPAQLGKYFANNSLIVLYPDQLGEPQDMLSFSNPRGNNEDQHYEKVGKWFYKWFKKSN
mgnify:CR=1 FL=1